MKNIYKIIVGLVITITAIIIGLKVTGSDDNEVMIVPYEDEAQPEKEINEINENANSNKVVVYVCGQVVSPGVYELLSGSRVYEALDMAGGFTSDAAAEYLNQAEFINDGARIYVPSKEEAKSMSQMISAETAKGGDALININTASKEELMSLAGVGESKAQAIITYRQNNGIFSDKQDIMQIPGIKEGLYNKIKDYICVY